MNARNVNFYEVADGSSLELENDPDNRIIQLCAKHAKEYEGEVFFLDHGDADCVCEIVGCVENNQQADTP